MEPSSDDILSEPIVDSSGRIATRRKRRIKTPPIAEAAARVFESMSTGCASSMIVGKPRLGKTFAARWICEAINQLMGPVHWFEIPFQLDQSRSGRRFFLHMLHCVTHDYAEGTDESVLRERLEEFLIERASESPLGTVILLLDEAQNLTERHWTYLAELSNKIDIQGLSVFTLSTGQRSLYEMRNTMRELPSERGGDFIIGRFFLDMNDYRGLRGRDDIDATFKEFDQSPLGPKDAQLWLEAALPEAYRSGWRLQNISDVIWEAYKEIWREAGRKSAVEIPMTFFDLLVRQILGSPQKYNCANPVFNLKAACDLVIKSQFDRYIK